MARVKRSVAGRKRRRAVLELARGYYGNKSRSFRSANEQVMHSLQYAYRDRRARKGDLRAIQLIAERTQGKPMRAVEISGPEGGALEMDHMTDEELDQRINELLAKVSSGPK